MMKLYSQNCTGELDWLTPKPHSKMFGARVEIIGTIEVGLEWMLGLEMRER
jgi:hypothetical protein